MELECKGFAIVLQVLSLSRFDKGFMGFCSSKWYNGALHGTFEIFQLALCRFSGSRF